MLGRRLYKTKLCISYQKGRCLRSNCNFAHGDAELRRFPGGSSFSGRRDYRSADLRDKLERRHSPHRRYSPGREARNYHPLHGQKHLSHDRGSSLSRSPVRRNERKHRKKQHVDGESDDSESLRMSDAEDPKKEDKVSSYDEKDALEEQLKQVQSDIERLEDHKSQLEFFLEEKTDDACKLSARIEDLEIQLNKEHEDCRRITSKIKKFIRAHERYLKAQEELKRSQARLQRLGDQIGSDVLKSGANEEDSSVNILSDGEPSGDKYRSPRNDELKNKRLHLYLTTSEEGKIGNLQKRGRFSGALTRSEKLIRPEGPSHQSDNDNKDSEATKLNQNKKDVHKSIAEDHKHKRGKINHTSITTLDKMKSSEVGRLLPSTSIAANAVDDFIEAVETEEKAEAAGGNAVYENGAPDSRANLSYMLPPPPPPPPINQNAYKKYEGDDEEVDVEKVDTDMLDIDLNSEVEIEQI